MAQEKTQEKTFEEIYEIINNLPTGDTEIGNQVIARDAQLTKPAGSLGFLEEIALWYHTWRAKERTFVSHPRIAVFAGNHGIAAENVSAFPSEVTAQMVSNFQHQGAAVNQLAGVSDADLRIFELSLDTPTHNFLHEAAMSEEETCTAIAYGMTAIDDTIDLLAVGEMGIANSTSAAAMAHAMFGGTASDWTGRGTGVDGPILNHKTDVVAKAIEKHQLSPNSDPMHILQHVGGFELAAIVGAIIAARMARVPVLLDGYACTVAASILYKIDNSLLDHCMVGHLSAEQAHQKLLNTIEKRPIFEYNMRLGEASGAALAINIVKAAVACHSGMATFAEAQVAGQNEA